MLRERFFTSLSKVAQGARDERLLELEVHCLSQPGESVRVMTAREQMESLAAHNAYHFGRVLLLRQMLGVWPPASGGFSW